MAGHIRVSDMIQQHLLFPSLAGKNKHLFHSSKDFCLPRAAQGTVTHLTRSDEVSVLGPDVVLPGLYEGHALVSMVK